IEAAHGQLPAAGGEGERGHRAVLAAELEAFRPRGQVPDLDAIFRAVDIAARHEERLAIRREGEGLVLPLRSGEAVERGAAGRVPDPDLPVQARPDRQAAG